MMSERISIRTESLHPIESLLEALRSPNGLARMHARESLEAMGRLAIPYLTRALADADTAVRWEAVKTLTNIGDPAAASALTGALDDEDSGIRWLAASGLARLGCTGLVAVLRALADHSDSPWVREAAHHVLTEMVKRGYRDIAAPVLQALADVEPALVAIAPARVALETIRLSELCDAG